MNFLLEKMFIILLILCSILQDDLLGHPAYKSLISFDKQAHNYGMGPCGSRPCPCPQSDKSALCLREFLNCFLYFC